jgi:hypothetical protein
MSRCGDYSNTRRMAADRHHTPQRQSPDRSAMLPRLFA